MTTVNMHGNEAAQDATLPVETSHAAMPPFPEMLLQVGSCLHATLIVDHHKRIARVDGSLMLASGWNGQAPQGRSAKEVLGTLPWLLDALDTALTGKAAVGSKDQVRALVLPVFGEGGQFLGACACMSAAESSKEEPALREALARELTRTQRRYEDLIDTIDGIVWEADASNFHITFVSRKAERLLGYPPEQWRREPDFWVNRLHPEDREWVSSFCLKANLECRPYELEYRMMAADGGTVWVRNTVTMLVEDGRPARLRGSFRDVTAEHCAREKLERTVSLLRATFDSIGDGVVVVDREKRIDTYNKRFQRLWGLPDDVLLTGLDAMKAVAAAAPVVKDPERFVTRLQEMFMVSDQEYVDTVEFRDGRILERTSLPQRLGDTIIGRIWSYRDVTEERHAKEAQERLLEAEQRARAQLEESFALLDTFLNNAPIGMGFLDRDLRFLRLNDALAALHGHNREEELGRPLHEMTPYVAPAIEPLMRRVLETGEPIIGLEMMGEVPATPGVPRSWRVSYYPVQTPRGGIVGVGAVVVEVTAERRAQEERERLLREAHEAIQIRDDFLSIASHELKTPLTPLKLHLQVLKQRCASGQPIPSHLAEKALCQVEKLSGLISDLLDASHVEAGQLAVVREPMLLRALVSEVLADFRLSSARHTLEYEECTEELVIEGDRRRIAQVMTNLLENAFKYSPLGGPIHVALTRSGSEVLVSVSDSGIGIPADQQAHLFERFFRARNAPISGFGGLGLGLYICRDIIERHGGRIRVESELGRGSTFRFTLPMRAAAPGL
jgi:PAS domain S-box-containing protein